MSAVTFKDRKELLAYKEREYIGILEYTNCEVLEKGDLPISGVLKEVKFTNNQLHSIKGEAIPNGVEKLIFSQAIGPMRPTTLLSTLPSSIKTVENVIPNNGEIIPPNITSILFKFCKIIGSSNSIIKEGDEVIIIPPTVTSLTFGQMCRNMSNTFKVGDLHNCLNRFHMIGYDQSLDLGVLPQSITDLEIGLKSNGILKTGLFPKNLKSLKLYCHQKEPTEKRENTGELIITSDSFSSLSSLESLSIDKADGVSVTLEQNSIPTSIKELSIRSFDSPINNHTLPLSQCNNLKKLELEYSNFNEDNIILPSILVNSITSLKILGTFNTPLSIGTIPNSVESLSFFKCTFNQPINQIGILPNSLKSLEFSDISYENLLTILAILPESLETLSIHQNLKELDIKFPSFIKNINYFNYYVDI